MSISEAPKRNAARDDILRDLKALRRKPAGDIYRTDLEPFLRIYRRDHALAQDLWSSGDDAARELAIRMADPAQADGVLLERWLCDIDEWGLCDGFCADLVRRTPYAVAKAVEWAAREPLFHRRAGFSLMAQLAWQKNEHDDAVFLGFLPLIEARAPDERPLVRKAVNWALRDIGKRNAALRPAAQAAALRLRKSKDGNSRWIGSHRMQEIGLP